MPPFIPGIELSRRFYWEGVRPILDRHYPGLPHAAARIGTGSDVLGFDTEMSRDHEWGPTVTLFLRDEDAHLADAIRRHMADELPDTIAGYSVDFTESPLEKGTFVVAQTATRPLNHRVYISTVKAFTQIYLNLNSPTEMTVADWLVLSSQTLLEVTAGAIHEDIVGELSQLRERLAWYPHDVWLYLLACGWQRIEQEEHLMPRAGYVGDEIGSTLIASRLVRDIMSLGFLMEQRYAPYPKWFGTAFARLTCAGELTPLLRKAQLAETWLERMNALAAAYEVLARMHNKLGTTPPMPETATNFFGRPFKVIHGSDFASAISARITDPAVKRLTERRLIGSIDQFSDSTDLRDRAFRSVLRQLWEE